MRFLILILATAFSSSIYALNDDCLNANVIVPSFTNCNTHAGSSANSTQSLPSCSGGGNADDDVWYSFTANSTSTTITVDPTIGYDAVIELFSGTCGSLVPIQCQDLNGLNGDEVLVNSSLTVGATYFFRVYHYGIGSGTSTFNVCVIGLAPPTNNTACNAFPLSTVTPSCNFDIYTNLGSAGSSVPTPSACGGSSPFQGGYAGGDVWFSVVVPASGELDIFTLDVDFSDGAMALYSGICSSLTLVECDDDGDPGDGILMPHIYSTGLTPGTTMYIRVWEFNNDANGQFGICVSSPNNDACVNAQQICDLNGYGGITSSSYTPEFPSNMTGTGQNGVANSNPTAPFGQGYAGTSPVQIDNNSWLKFTASATSASLFVQVNHCSNGNGMQMQIFSGTNCTNFTAVSNFLETTNSQTITATGLTIGNDYYIMIDGFAGDICSYTISATSGVQVVEAISSKSAICIGDTATISGLVTGTGSYTYNWSSTPIGFSSTLPTNTIAPVVNTLYSVDITGVCGSTTTASIYVTANTLPNTNLVASPDTICAGQTMVLNPNLTNGTPSFTHSWTGTGQSFLNNLTTLSPTFSTVNQGDYTLKYQVVDTIGCTTKDSILVTVNPLPIITLIGNNIICIGDTTTLTASGGETYSWNTGGILDSIIVNPTTNTNYTVTSTDVNSCVNFATINVQVNTLPSALILGSPLICEGNSTTLVASGGTSYQWNNGATTPSITVSPIADSTYFVAVLNANGCMDTTSLTVQVLTAPNAAITGNDTICFGDNVALTASGGGNYLWNNGLTSATINMSPIADTTYKIIVDISGCIDSSSYTVIVNALPVIGITGNSAICIGDTTTLSASGGDSYSWNIPGTLDSILVSPLASTNYTAIVTDLNSCVDSVTINVQVNALPIPLILGSTLICEGNSTTLVASGGSSYQWNNGATTPSITVSPITDSTYLVTVLNTNGCIDTTSLTVQVLTAPNATITGNDTICFGETVALTASGGGTYLWNNGLTSATINMSPIADTTYKVTVDVGGCIDSSSYAIFVNPLPIVGITGNFVICEGDFTTLLASGVGTYAWNNGGILDSIIVSPNTSSNYTLILTDANNCKDSSTISVQVNQLPTINVIGNLSICEGESTTLTASGASTYVWNTAVTTTAITVNPLINTNYTVLGTNGNGCKDSTQITVAVLPQPTANISGITTICFGESAILTATGGGSYNWNTSDTTAVITVNPTDTTTYSVLVNVGGCIDSATYSVNVTTLPVIIAFSDTTIILGQSAALLAQGGAVYTWSPTDGLSCAICPAPAAKPKETTTYCVSSTENGCVNSSCVTVYVDNICGDLFVPNAFSPNGDGSNDCLKVHNNCLEKVLFRVYSRWGQLIYETEEIDGCWDGTDNGKILNTGVYTYTVAAKLINGEEVEIKGNVSLFK